MSDKKECVATPVCFDQDFPNKLLSECGTSLIALFELQMDFRKNVGQSPKRIRIPTPKGFEVLGMKVEFSDSCKKIEVIE